MGLFGQGSDTFNQSFGLGLGGSDSFTGMNALGLSAARSPQELQAGLLRGSTQLGGAINTNATERGDNAIGIGSAIGKGIEGIAGFFSG